MATFFYVATNPFASLTGIAPIILIFVVFYMFMIRPGQRRQKSWQEMLGKLKPGDRVTTTGGLRGKVISVKEDVIRLGIDPDNIKVEVARAAIASVTTNDEAPK
jgi:preprotein translocase subunit YajC